LVKHGLAPLVRAEIVTLQGAKMGRPSRLHITIGSKPDGAVTRVQVGGESVLVAEGTLFA
jgi:predicted PhzF superfamily epimerase YddE/YHI9